MKHTIEIQNLKCGGCVKTIENNLNKIVGVDSIEVDVENSNVILQTNTENALPLAENKLREIGYPPVGMKNSVIIKAKSFVSCATGKMNQK
jgi:copper chaperone CopZ